MPPFKFRLEQVRLYRKQLEEQAMQALAEAVMRRDALAEHIAALESSIAEHRVKLCGAAAMGAAERWLVQGYLSGLCQDHEQAGRQLAEAEHYVDACRTVLVERAKERGLLDSLKEKQAQRHLLLERQQEQKTNDETATLRYKPVSF